MFYIRIADLNICIDNKYKYSERLCGAYMIDECAADITVSVTEREIAAEKALAEIEVSDGYAEGVCIYRNLCKRLPRGFDAYLFHSALIEYEGRGYAFSAKSGTGKSTHIALWQKEFGEGVRIINGDKPILRYQGGEFVGYGTPWCGKEGLSTNDSVPLKAICFLERGEKNEIKRISPEDAVARIFHQILTPEDMETLDALLPLLDLTLKMIPCYLLHCNMDTEAARVAYNGMKK
ncbi:MAG: hypothetical protein J6V42_01870 [Clostridia bacterium]|nr:hypothetical protein [Clostridia bacterium]